MMNSLQLVICIPALSIIFPSNAKFVISIILDIATFELVNPIQFFLWIFPFLDKVFAELETTSVDSLLDEKMTELGFESRNIFTNSSILIGTMLLLLIFVVVDRLVSLYIR